MIVYKNILEQLKSKGYTTTRLRKENLVSESVLSAIRQGKMIKLSSIDNICKLLDCKVEDIIEYKKDCCQ